MAAKAGMAGNTLVYGHRKQDDIKWDISTPELRAKAFLELFNELKTTWQVFECDYWGANKNEETLQKGLYALACKGDAEAAERLLRMRIDYEYENWRIVDAPTSVSGEPRTVLARRPGKIFVKDIRKQDNGRYSFQLSNGEQIEFAYVPINTTKPDWENGWMIHGFFLDALYEKLGRDRQSLDKTASLLSHMNYMRLTLYYTMFPEQMPLGKDLSIWQRVSLQHADSLIDQYGDNPVEKINDKKKRPTSLQKAQDALSELVLNYEGLISLTRRALEGKYDKETVLKHDLNSHQQTLSKIKKVMLAE
jgi:hypothetical protein